MMLFHFMESFNAGLHLSIYRLISFKLGVMIKTTKIYILRSVWMTLTFIITVVCKLLKSSVCIFSETLQLICMKISMLPQPLVC